MTDNGTAAANTDRELWREPTDEVGMEHYQPSIHVTKRGGIGINVGGMVIVKSLRAWYALAMPEMQKAMEESRMREAQAAYLAAAETQGKSN